MRDSLECYLDLLAMDEKERTNLSQRTLATRWNGTRRAVGNLLVRLEESQLIEVSALKGKTSIKVRTTLEGTQGVDSKGTCADGENEKRTTLRTTFEGSQDVCGKEVTTSDLQKSAPPEIIKPTIYIYYYMLYILISNSVVGIKKRGARARFVKPTLVQLSEHAESIGFKEFNAQKFFDHYDDNNWRLSSGKGKKMSSWKRAVAYWQENHEKWNKKQGKQEVISFE